MITIASGLAAQTKLIARMSGRGKGGNCWEIDLSHRNVIEIVGKCLPGDDSRNLPGAVTGSSNAIEVLIRNPATVFYQLPREIKRDVYLAFGRRGLASIGQFSLAQTHRLPNRAVHRHME